MAGIPGHLSQRRVADMGMTNQPCPHHPQADPAEVPTSKILEFKRDDMGLVDIPPEPAPCGNCWRNHALWVKGISIRDGKLLLKADMDLHTANVQLATAKADVERYLRSVMAAYEEDGGEAAYETAKGILGVIDKAKESK